jgi:type IV pilus assembly protein PilV
MPTSNTPRPYAFGRRSQGGFTLIEVLIAVIVLSIGLLGVASLQLTSKRGNFEAMQRAAATLYAEDLVERMRTNPSVLGSYVTSTGLTLTAAPSTPPDCTGGCTLPQLAEYDIAKWWDQLAGESEGGRGGLVTPTACLSNPVTNEYIVAIAWRGMDEVSDVATGTAQDCGRGATYDLSGELSFRRIITLRTYIDPTAG